MWWTIPNVGENLQNHVLVTVSSEVKDGLKTMDPLRRRDPAALDAAREAYGKGSRPLATSVELQLLDSFLFRASKQLKGEEILRNSLKLS